MTDHERNLGIMVNSLMKVSINYTSTVTKAKIRLGTVRNGTENTDTNIYQSIIKAHLEYWVQFWWMQFKKDNGSREGLQWLLRAIKMIKQLEQFPYGAL